MWRRWMMDSLSVLAALAVLVLLPAQVGAQGVLVVENPQLVVRLPRSWLPSVRPPQPPLVYKIKELDMQAQLQDQVAQVQLAQTFENTGSRTLEAAFIFPLPYDGAIESMTLLIDGKEHPARLLNAQEAHKLYEDIVRKNKDPALLEWVGTGLFRTRVFPIPPGATRTVSLRYTQLCRKQEGLSDCLFPLSTARYSAQPLEKISLRISIASSEDIKNIYSPSHAIEVQRSDEKHASVSYVAKNEVPANDLRLFYDIGAGKISTRVLSFRPEKEDEGFFLLLASPQIKATSSKQSAKTVLLVMDRSGSMSGKKIEQVRAALKDVLNKLHPGDTFNIVAYDNQVQTFQPELQVFDEDSRKAALGFVEGLHAGGSTNIDAALQAALGQLQDPQRPSYVVFLTDGLPTAGERNEMKIVANAKERNTVRARIFSFGVGFDVNARLLDRLVRENYGQSTYVRPNEDIERQVVQLYSRIESPVLTDIHLDVLLDSKPEEGKPINRVYPQGSFDLFAGEQLVMVGRYKKPGEAKVRISGKEQTFEFPASFVARSKDDNNSFIEKLWATRRVGEILDELDLKGQNEELVKELVELATRHGILTPYTSFLADEGTNVRAVTANVATTTQRLKGLEQTDGKAGVAQRAMRNEYRDAKGVSMANSVVLSQFQADVQPGSARAGAPSLDFATAAGKEVQSAEQSLRNIGSRTFFRRAGRWVDSLVSQEQEDKATRIKQFSDAYFALARRHGRALAQYLAFDEPAVVTIGEQTYMIEP